MEVFQDYVPAQERIDILQAVIDRVTAMKDRVIKDSKYCKVCKKYYFKTKCDIDSRRVKKSICVNPLTGGYFDPYKYEEQIVTEYYWKCPEGHEIEGYVEGL